MKDVPLPAPENLLKTKALLLALLLSALVPSSVSADVQFWDPDGATVGTSVSGNWNLTASNWTATADSGTNTVWIQGNEAGFGVTNNYTVTLTEPIIVGNVTLTGTNGTLTISGTSLNSLTLGAAATFNTGGRNLTLSAPINGIFDLTRTGAGTLTLSGASTYSGGTTLSAGTTTVGVDTVSSGGVITSGPFGTRPVTISAAATISATGSARSVENPITLNTNLTIAGSTALTFSNGVWTLNGANRTVTVNNTANTVFQANLTDDGVARTLTKAGTGRLIMRAGETTSFLGGVTASAGTLVAGNGNPFPTNNNNQITINGSTFDLNGFDVRVSRLGGNATGSVLLGTNTLTAGGAQSSEFSGVINGTGGYVKVGSVSQVLSGTNTFSGGILITESVVYFPTNGLSGSDLALGPGRNTITITGSGRIGVNRGTATITNNIVLANVGPTAGLDPANGALFTLAGQISGSGGILRYTQGSGIPTLSASNTFTGGVEMDARTLGIGHKNALGTGPFIIGHPTTPPGNTIMIATATDLSGVNAIANPTTINQNFTIFATNDFELSGPMTVSNAITLTTIGSVAIFSGNIDGPGGFTKLGTNVLVFKGANTYAGSTIVGQGTLLVNNTSGSGTSTGAVTVVADATLGGTGTIGGPVTVNSGGNIGAGSSVGRLTLTNGLDLSAGGTDVWELAANKDGNNGTAGTDFDQLSLTGGNLVLGGSSTLLLQFIGSATFPDPTSSFWQANHTWKIIALSGAATNPGNSNFSGISGTNGISAGTFSTSVDASGSVVLSYVSATPPRPVIESNIAGAGTTNATLRWTSVPGATYEVRYRNEINDTNWFLLGSVTATNSTASIVDTSNPPAPKRFYRVFAR
jgi:autotransporter-associated beta strand protein